MQIINCLYEDYLTVRAMLIRIFDPEGRMLPSKNIWGFYLADLNYVPFRIEKYVKKVRDGMIKIEVPDRPFQVFILFNIPNFGRAYIPADNEGVGYDDTYKEINLNVELARTRYSKIIHELNKCDSKRYVFSDEFYTRLRAMEKELELAEKASSEKEKAVHAIKALSNGMWAGEMLAFEKAKQDIERHGRREGFLFGCNFFGHPRLGEKYDKFFKEIFNYATIPFYWAFFEPEKGKKKWKITDEMVSWLRKENIKIKGHPLVWFYEPAGIPKWIKGRSYEEVCAAIEKRIEEIVKRYEGKIYAYDVINEAHDWANDLDYSRKQLLEITELACNVVKENDPNAVRIINNCCIWGEYVAYGKDYRRKVKRNMWTPLEYVKACIERGIDFDYIGLQLYYPERDMFEISLMLDRYAELGKPIHITELAVSSSNTKDENSFLKEPPGLWHEPWNEKVQADWVEQFYTICYSKPYIEAITWWDLADKGHFWPHGGLLRPDFTPKEAYFRLKKLIERWSSL